MSNSTSRRFFLRKPILLVAVICVASMDAAVASAEDQGLLGALSARYKKFLKKIEQDQYDRMRNSPVGSLGIRG